MSRAANGRAARPPASVPGPRSLAGGRLAAQTCEWTRRGCESRLRRGRGARLGRAAVTGARRAAQGREGARRRCAGRRSARFGQGHSPQKHAGPGRGPARRDDGCGGRYRRGPAQELGRSRCERPRRRAASTANSPDPWRGSASFHAALRRAGLWTVLGAPPPAEFGSRVAVHRRAPPLPGSRTSTRFSGDLLSPVGRRTVVLRRPRRCQKRTSARSCTSLDPDARLCHVTKM